MNPQTQGCLRLFRVGGITVLLHWSWFLVAGVELRVRAHAYPSWVWNVAEYLTIFGIVLLHEFGHALACRQVGGVAERIVLWPLGGVAFVNPPPRPGALLWSIAAGPLVNLALVPVTIALVFLEQSVAPPALAVPLRHFCVAIAVINAFLLILNLLPIYPLDGGQILHALLWFVLGRARSLMVSGVIGVLGAVGLAVAASYLGSVWWIVLAVFVGFRALNGIQVARKLLRYQPALELIDGAQSAVRRGEHEPAIDDCGRALELLPAGDPFTANAYAVRAQALAALGEHDDAIDDYGAAIRLLSRVAAYRIGRGYSHAQLGQYDLAEDDYRAALPLDGGTVSALNNLAWLWATCPDAAFRDGAEAVKYATRACQLSNWRQPSCLGTLAAAYAEAGEFDAAITWQEKALEDSAYDMLHGEKARLRLQLYARGRPYREEIERGEGREIFEKEAGID